MQVEYKHQIRLHPVLLCGLPLQGKRAMEEIILKLLGSGWSVTNMLGAILFFPPTCNPRDISRRQTVSFSLLFRYFLFSFRSGGKCLPCPCCR